MLESTFVQKTKMKKIDYFKIAFIFSTVFIIVTQFVFGLLTSNAINDLKQMENLIFRSLFVGTFTGIILGMLNVFFKAFPIRKAK